MFLSIVFCLFRPSFSFLHFLSLSIFSFFLLINADGAAPFDNHLLAINEGKRFQHKFVFNKIYKWVEYYSMLQLKKMFLIIKGRMISRIKKEIEISRD